MKKILLLALLLNGFCAWAQTITLGAEDDWAPYSSAVNGQAQGFAVDVVRESFAAVGVSVKFEVLPYVRCMAKAKAGGLVGCFDAVPNSLIANSYLWPKRPLFTSHMNIYGLAHSSESGLTATSLEGKTVGVVRDYEYGDELDLNTRVVRQVVIKNENGFRMLLAKRIAYMAAEERIANALFKRTPDLAGKFKQVGAIATPGLYIAFTKESGDGAKYLELFNQGFDAINKSGQYKAIERQWF